MRESFRTLACCLLAAGYLYNVAPCGAVDERAIEELSRCVVLLENSVNEKYITGVLVDGAAPRILTNYHILSSSADTISAYVNAADGTIEKCPCRFIKGDPLRDMALFSLSLPRLPSTNAGVDTRAAGGRPAIRRGREVLFLGFPLYYGIMTEPGSGKRIKRPVCRKGMIASEISDGEYMIDAMVNNGNSGSPVFVLIPARQGAAARYVFAGLIKEYQHDQIPCSINGTMIKVPHNAGLGIVIPVDVIADFVGRE
jgi:S1-C subfamily serine protease